MGLYLLHLHLHGLFRGHDLELGRDPDTGGQTTYVLELARSLAARDEVERLEVVTRLIHDRRVSPDYARPVEPLAPGATIRRFAFGPRRYLRKELLWPHLDELADALAEHLIGQPRLPDWIHAHYADAGYVGAALRRRLGIPLVFTGHSLGREKRRRLMAAGLDAQQIERQYAMERRIEAEELALAHSELVVTSTRQETEQQYARYGGFRPDLAQVIPPGVDAGRFHPPLSGLAEPEADPLVEPFLRDPQRPPLLAISRADPRKNIPALIEVFGRSELLRRRHNLVLVLGCRDDPSQLEKPQRDLFQQVFELVDRYDLYGLVAYPKRHRCDQIPALFRWAARRRGVFVNPALTEPFGLTLLEAAASGLPLVATDDGGPRDIVERCRNGVVVDVSDSDALQQAIEEACADPDRWRRWRDNGIEALCRHYSWDAHVQGYLAVAAERTKAARRPALTTAAPASPKGRRLVLLDLDDALGCPDTPGLGALRACLRGDPWLCIGLVSGRSFELARLRASELRLPPATLWITRAGTEIHSLENGEWHLDQQWRERIAGDWNREGVVRALAGLAPRLRLQDASEQGPFKVSFLLQEPGRGVLPVVRQQLRRHALAARPHLFQHWYLDVLPLWASKSDAIRHVALRWQLPLGAILIAVSQQGDGELLRGLPLGVVPDGHDPALATLRGNRRVFFADRPVAWGVLDGLEHHSFIGR
jgi:sucrose-phosphate synthase